MKKVEKYWAGLKTKILSDLHIHYDMIYYLKENMLSRASKVNIIRVKICIL